MEEVASKARSDPVATGTVDTVPLASAAEDQQDTGPVATAPDDATAPVDTAPVDTGPVDSAPLGLPSDRDDRDDGDGGQSDGGESLASCMERPAGWPVPPPAPAQEVASGQSPVSSGQSPTVDIGPCPGAGFIQAELPSGQFVWVQVVIFPAPPPPPPPVASADDDVNSSVSGHWPNHGQSASWGHGPLQWSMVRARGLQYHDRRRPCALDTGPGGASNRCAL